MSAPNFLAELKRRNVIRVAIAYVAVSWLVMQAGALLVQTLELPNAISKGVFVLLVIAFIPTLVFSWLYEMTPEGLKRESEIDRDASITHLTGRRLDYLVIGVLAAVVALLLVDKFVLTPRQAARVAASRPAPAPQTAPTQLPAEAAANAPAPTARQSIAVLAFTDLSPGKDHEYLSDGIAEEVLNALTRVPGLKVAGRTSSFHFKGSNEDLRAVGKALGVAHVLEGSVRTQGDKVRITAQLVRTDDGFHLWSENYEGQLTDVFDLQDRIARKIVREFDVVLRSGDSARMVAVATRSPEAYALYLRAGGVLSRREVDRYDEATAWLEQVIALDPKFARAHALLANLIVAGGANSSREQAVVESSARRALELDPKLAGAHVALARLYLFARPQTALKARAEIEQAIALGPDDADVNFSYAQALLYDGYVNQGIERLDRTLAIDPLLPNALFWRGLQDLAGGRVAQAQQSLQLADEVGLAWSKRGLFELAKAQGDFKRATELLDRSAPAGAEPCAGVSYVDLPADIKLGRPARPADRAAALATVERCLASKPDLVPAWVQAPLVDLAPERALAVMQATPSQNEAGARWRMWWPAGRALRTLPGFQAYAEQVGLVDVWEKYGPPDLCRRVAPRTYRCE